MANYAHLAAFEPVDRVLVPGNAPELEAKFHVPIFWLVMFDESCLRDEPLSGVRYGKSPDEHFAIQPPYLVSDSAAAIARLKQRTAALSTLVGADQRKLLGEFVKFARRLKPQVVCRLNELAAMTDLATYTRTLRAALAAVAKLDDAAAQPADYLDAIGAVWNVAEWREQHQDALLAGWGWQVSSEEREARARERKWQKAVGGKDTSELVPYAATTSFQPEQLIQHATLGAGLVVRCLDGSKIEVLFRDGARTLVHGRK